MLGRWWSLTDEKADLLVFLNVFGTLPIHWGTWVILASVNATDSWQTSSSITSSGLRCSKIIFTQTGTNLAFREGQKLARGRLSWAFLQFARLTKQKAIKCFGLCTEWKHYIMKTKYGLLYPDNKATTRAVSICVRQHTGCCDEFPEYSGL